MVEILTKEFILMGGAVDTVSVAGAGRRPPAPNASVTAGSGQPPWGALLSPRPAPGLLALADPMHSAAAS